ncbi:hypothetical protein [Bacillus swezeyi]|uniref:hypothetical protein n=1 Tax=Bacillus swezeyi TaxID=1925020 RepID=UPI0016537BF1|nr:hypothetical protein [Bacillus swezeyi]
MFNKKTLKRNLVEMKNKDLINFLKKEFPPEQNYATLNTKIQVIKSLSHNDLSAELQG